MFQIKLKEIISYQTLAWITISLILINTLNMLKVSAKIIKHGADNHGQLPLKFHQVQILSQTLNQNVKVVGQQDAHKRLLLQDLLLSYGNLSKQQMSNQMNKKTRAREVTQYAPLLIASKMNLLEKIIEDIGMMLTGMHTAENNHSFNLMPKLKMIQFATVLGAPNIYILKLRTAIQLIIRFQTLALMLICSRVADT